MPVCPITPFQIPDISRSRLPDGLDPWVYYAQTEVQFHVDHANVSGKWFPFRLDTGTLISIIPTRWFDGILQMIGPLSELIPLNTVAGQATATGRVAQDVPISFRHENGLYTFDFMLTDSLTSFGLLSLRDLHNHFRIRQSQRPVLAADRPLILGSLVLTPWE